MRFLVFTLLICCQLSAQSRKEKPLPIFSKEPLSKLEKNVQGWSYSLDGQWISSKKKIPIRTVSTNKGAYKSKPEYLGMENFSSFKLYPAIYGKDTVILLVKVYKDGRYRYNRTKKGWKEFNRAYYYVLHKEEFRKLDDLQDSVVQIYTLDLLDDGEVVGVKKSRILGEIRSKIKINPDHDRQMVVMVQPFTSTNRMRFQIFSQHLIFKDVAGILSDFNLRGESLYGKPDLFNYLYYETGIDQFSQLFTVPMSFDFKL